MAMTKSISLRSPQTLVQSLQMAELSKRSQALQYLDIALTETGLREEIGVALDAYEQLPNFREREKFLALIAGWLQNPDNGDKAEVLLSYMRAYFSGLSLFAQPQVVTNAVTEAIHARRNPPVQNAVMFAGVGVVSAGRPSTPKNLTLKPSSNPTGRVADNPWAEWLVTDFFTDLVSELEKLIPKLQTGKAKEALLELKRVGLAHGDIRPLLTRIQQQNSAVIENTDPGEWILRMMEGLEQWGKIARSVEDFWSGKARIVPYARGGSGQ